MKKKQNLIKNLIDTGVQFAATSQASAERVVSELVEKGEMRRKDAERTVQKLVERSRSSSDQLLSTVQSEVAKQFGRFADRIDALESRLEELAGRLGAKRQTAARIRVIRGGCAMPQVAATGRRRRGRCLQSWPSW